MNCYIIYRSIKKKSYKERRQIKSKQLLLYQHKGVMIVLLLLVKTEGEIMGTANWLCTTHVATKAVVKK